MRTSAIPFVIPYTLYPTPYPLNLMNMKNLFDNDSSEMLS